MLTELIFRYVSLYVRYSDFWINSVITWMYLIHPKQFTVFIIELGFVSRRGRDVSIKLDQPAALYKYKYKYKCVFVNFETALYKYKYK